ncbi:cob(I)yrinic acid a c-diamide adenosyltransferase [Streptomonospora sp. PA3]|uniref:ATP:cob(I)alamin adenosyltransferase n=1 Tax=Streptomonospora sp. PA3 TaxID=2607326 RepID=UPI00164328EF|nr:cob(I)yrinic acid a c-diamide adenosyltransferase [Streptomonospora sp. PA3]
MRDTEDKTTVLGDNSVVSKGDPRVGALACCDDAAATIGLVIAFGGALPEVMVNLLAGLQNDLLDVYADLHTPTTSDDAAQVRITQAYIDRVQGLYDAYTREVDEVPGAVIPGGTASAAFLHKARASVRMAEHYAWIAVEENGASMNTLAPSYLNQLSALLFVLARSANAEHGDLLWQPGLTLTATEESVQS